MMGQAARGWGVANLAAGAMLLGILLARIFQQPLQPYRTAKVPFIHHGIRLRGLDAVQDLGSWNPLQIYALLDSPYPPGLHFVGFAWGALFGLEAESVTFSALLWGGLLALCVGVSARRLGGSKQAAVAAGLFTALLPCVHGSSTIYYFDLPYLSLVWLAVLCVLPRPGARPIAQGLRGGLAFVAACTAKWTALPLGSPFLLGALLCGSRQQRRQRLFASTAFAVTTGILLALVLSSSDGSLRGTFETQADTSGHQDSIFGLRSKPSDLVPRAAYMSIHFVSAGLSPALAIPLLFLALLWLLRDRRGLPLVAMAGLASLVFVGLIAADEDERLIVPATTLVSLCAGLGLDSIRSPQRARRLAAGIVALGLLVAWDFHHSPRAPWNTEIVLFRPNHPAMDPARLRGLGAVSSVEGMGWNRRDETPDVPGDFLAALGQAFQDDRSQDVLVTVAAENLGVHSVWFEYQHLLAYHRGERQRSDTFARTVLPCETQDHNARHLLIVTGEAFPSCLERAHWQKDQLIEGNSLSLTLFLRTPPAP